MSQPPSGTNRPSDESTGRRAPSSRPLRVGIVGVGYWGPNLARNVAEARGAELVAVADLSEERLSHLAQRHPDLKTTTRHLDLIDIGIDAVIVATPPATHYRIARSFLEQGIHCLVEKPLATTVEDAEDLVNLARAKDVRLMTGHTFEYNPAVHKIRSMIRSGELGEVFYLDAVRTNLGLFQLNTDVMWDLAPHDISIANYLLDAQPERVSAHGSSFVMRDVGINDVVYLHLDYPGGKRANIRVSWLDPNKTRRTTVVGNKKMLVYDDVETLEKLRVYDKGVDPIPFTDTYGEFQCSYRYGDVTIPHISWQEPLRLECQHFVDCVLNGTTPDSDGVSGLRVVKVLEAATRSLESGQKVDVDQVHRGDANRLAV